MRWAREGVLIESCSTWRRALARSRRSLMMNPSVERCRRRLRFRFSRTERMGMIPSFLRSSGHATSPARMASLGPRIRTGRPPTFTVPVVARAAP